MDKKPIIGILLEFGFHEIKKYIHSGFAQKLSENFNIVWLAIDKGNEDFDKYFRNTGFPLVYFSIKDFPEINSKVEAINQSVRRNWMKYKNLGLFHNYRNVGKKNLKSILIGSDLIKKFYENKTLKEINKIYTNDLLEETFIKYNINNLFSTSYASAFSKYAYFTARLLNIKTWYLVNSWKDLYTNNFLPFDFLDGIFVWSEQMKNDYIYHMPYLKPEKIIVSGNPTFDVLKNSRPVNTRSFYAKKYRIPENADWLLYTMMPPGLVNDEIETIILVAKEILKNFTPEEKVLIIRKNPNHSLNDFTEVNLPKNAVLAQHFCTFDNKNDMIVQTPEGEQEWIDLLHHCSMNLSVPSTVTLEFLTLNKPVINIGFGPDGNPDPRLNQHLEAGFYKPIFKNNLVDKVLYIKELNYKIKLVLSQASSSGGMDRNNLASDLASDLILKRILEN